VGALRKLAAFLLPDALGQPGGVGTLEEALALLAVKLQNPNHKMPMRFLGPEQSQHYIDMTTGFLDKMLGDEHDLREYCDIPGVQTPEELALAMQDRLLRVYEDRAAKDDDTMWNYTLDYPPELLQPFNPTHESMAEQKLSMDMPVIQRLLTLRRIMKGITFGAVTQSGREAIDEHGKFQIRAEREVADELESLLRFYAHDQRLSIDPAEPCYEVVPLKA
jgi:hypothetical protein